MTPKEKAKDLVSKYIHLTKQTNGANGTVYNSKQCALIAVNEILSMYLCSGCQDCCVNTNYWQEVKQEINNL
jgi:hypothetical protein